MKESYPCYKNTTFDRVKENLSSTNRRLINDFLKYCEITACDSSIRKISGKIVQIADVFEKSLASLDLEDVRAFLRLLNISNRAIETQNDTKKVLKRFIKWKYENWSKRFAELRDARTRDGTNHKKLNSETMLTADELHMIVGSIESLKYKALILLMYESGGRPEEIVKLKWKDINLDRSQVTLSSAKTGRTRTNPVDKSVAQLRRYRVECFYDPARSEDYVFPSPRNKQKHLTVAALNDYFLKVETKLRFKKHVFPYILRHSRLTPLIRLLSPKVYEKFAGHSIQTGIKRYAHIDNKDVHDEMFSKVYQISDVTPEEKDELRELRSQVQGQKGELEGLRQEVQAVRSGKGFMTLLASLNRRQGQMEGVLAELTGRKFDIVFQRPEGLECCLP